LTLDFQLFLFNTTTVPALKRIFTIVSTARPKISRIILRNFRKVLNEPEASRSSRKRAWENLQELRWVFLDSAGMKLPPAAKKTTDLEGKADQRGVRKAMDRTIRTQCAECFLSFSCRTG
jgi:hypothetical protein